MARFAALLPGIALCAWLLQPASAQAQRVWRQVDLPYGPPSALAADASGVVWIRFDAGGASESLVGIDANGRRVTGGRLEQAVPPVAGSLSSLGLPDISDRDRSGRIWFGGKHFDGQRWARVLPTDGILGGVAYEPRALADRLGAIWLPYQLSFDCPLPPCYRRGLRRFDDLGPATEAIEIESVDEADAFGLPALRLLPGNADLAPVALGHRAMYRLPDAEPIPYPDYVVEPGALRNAGYLCAATREFRDPIALLWVEVQTPEGVEYRMPARRYDLDRDRWIELLDMASSRLFQADPKNLRPVAAAFQLSPGGPEYRLWVASSAGDLALFFDGQLGEFHAAEEIGLVPGETIRSIAIQGLHGIWLATDQRVLYLGDANFDWGDTIYLPLAPNGR